MTDVLSTKFELLDPDMQARVRAAAMAYLRMSRSHQANHTVDILVGAEDLPAATAQPPLASVPSASASRRWLPVAERRLYRVGGGGGGPVSPVGETGFRP
jgi:hypothetical protein